MMSKRHSKSKRHSEQYRDERDYLIQELQTQVALLKGQFGLGDIVNAESSKINTINLFWHLWGSIKIGMQFMGMLRCLQFVFLTIPMLRRTRIPGSGKTVTESAQTLQALFVGDYQNGEEGRWLDAQDSKNEGWLETVKGVSKSARNLVFTLLGAAVKILIAGLIAIKFESMLSLVLSTWSFASTIDKVFTQGILIVGTVSFFLGYGGQLGPFNGIFHYCCFSVILSFIFIFVSITSTNKMTPAKLQLFKHSLTAFTWLLVAGLPVLFILIFSGSLSLTGRGLF